MTDGASAIPEVQAFLRDPRLAATEILATPEMAVIVATMRA